MHIDGIKILVSQAAIVGIGFLWFNFNQTVFYAVRDIILKTYDEMQEEQEESDEEEELLTRLGEVKHLEEEKIRSIVKDLLNN